MTEIDNAQNNMQCENCKFYINVNKYCGMCKRYPPTIWSDCDCIRQNFPIVNHKEWCGEFKSRESHDD